MRLGKTEIKDFSGPYVIAELGANHNGDMDIARKLVDAAKAAGCDCVKFQSWTKESLFSKRIYSSDASNLKTRRDGKAEPSLEEMLDKYSMTKDRLSEMAGYCRKIGIDFASSIFSEDELDLVADGLQVPFLKVASMDLNYHPFLEKIAKKKKPVLLSTGLGSLDEITQAVSVLKKAGCRELALLHCVSVYPLPDELANLNNIDMLRDKFRGVPIGFSDHSLGVAVALGAAAKGACVIEKHFTLDRNMEGWDHAVSATPNEMRTIVEGSRRIVKALGSYERVLSKQEKENLPKYRRSVVAASRIEKGRTIRAEDLTAKRPGGGIEPSRIPAIAGKRAKRTIEADETLVSEDF